MEREVADLLEHLDRYRAVTLQALDLVDAARLDWRPGPDYYSLCQQFVHIAQAEDFHSHGVLEEDWDVDRVRLPKECRDREWIRSFFEAVRAFTRPRIEALSRADLDRILTIPGTPGEWTVRSWLWFILEHELHHKGQIWLYLRQMGITPPFYAMPLEKGHRPDIAARQDLGGFQFTAARVPRLVVANVTGAGGVPNEIVEADRRAVQSYAAGDNSYRSSVMKLLDGPAAQLKGVMPPGVRRRAFDLAETRSAIAARQERMPVPMVAAHIERQFAEV